MGFFSKIKKFWKGGESAQDQGNEKRPQEHSLPREESETVQQHLDTETEEVASASSGQEEDWQKELTYTLQEAEPKLSIWLDHILRDVEYANQELWSRLKFLFDCLEIPENEANDFIHRFRNWLDDMDYEMVSEFRSELQYRLALALDLEDEEDEQNRLFLKLSHGLNKTKEQLSKRIDNLLNLSSEFDEKFWEELEEILVMADVGMQTTTKLIDRLQSKVRQEKITDSDEFKAEFQKELAALFPEAPKKIKPAPPEVFLMVGVNGVGKTTTIAKLAHRSQMQGKKVLVAAGDTFRAAAIEQMEIWAHRVGAGFYKKSPESDPAAVAFEALEEAKKEGYDQLIVDTAGRLHTKVNLMDELKKIKKVLHKNHPGAPHRNMLVVDATTGQNAISQTQLFHQGIGVDEIILTKLDGTAKGGVALSISIEQGIPISYIGLGEKMEDLRPFDGEKFAQALLE